MIRQQKSRGGVSPEPMISSEVFTLVHIVQVADKLRFSMLYSHILKPSFSNGCSFRGGRPNGGPRVRGLGRLKKLS
jgi:hypothetical protein